jgi:signal transduction histidine kinase
VSSRRGNASEVAPRAAPALLASRAGEEPNSGITIAPPPIRDLDRMAHADRLATLGTLTAGVAHEINNPLQTIIGNLRLLEEQLTRDASRPNAAATSEILHDALEATYRVRQIVRDISMFARVDDTNLTELDVNEVLASAISMISGQLPRGARIIEDFLPVAPVLASRTGLCQVFVNLLLNALHAIGDRGALGEVHVRTGTSSTGQVRVEFSDNGAGIPTSVLAHIFEPFFTTKVAGEGTGLGLSICQRLVDAFGGKIRVESSPGFGANFRVELPGVPSTPTSNPATIPSGSG